MTVRSPRPATPQIRLDPGEQDRGAQLDQFLQAAQGAFSGNTERALRADLTIYAEWCGEHRHDPLPASPGTVAAFVDAMANLRAPATVRRYVSSIALANKAVGHADTLKSPLVKLALQRMHRKRGRRQGQVLGLTWTLRQRLLAAAGDRLIDARNRSLLAVAYDTLLRRSELTSLQVTDLFIETHGAATLLVRRGKTDPEGKGAMTYLARDTVELVRQWLAPGGISGGRLFRSLSKGGAVGEKLDPSQIPRIYKAMACRAGLPAEIVEGLSGHSPRVGAAQDMIASGIEMPAILNAGRWKSTAMVNRYGERLLAHRNGAAQLAKLQQRE